MQLHGLLPLLEPILEPARAAVDAGERLVLGVPDGAKPAVVAALARDRPVLVIAGKTDRAERFAEELAAWTGAESRVFLYPESDAIPYERTADTEAAQERLAVLQALHRHNETMPIVVAPIQALAQPTIAPAQLNRSAETVRAGSRLKMDALLRRLESLGYAFEPLVEGTGQAARRGGIVDVFPPDATLPVRIEFLGDSVDSLRRYHPATQRTTELIAEVVLGPAREAQADPDRIAALRASMSFEHVELGLRPRLEEELDQLERGTWRGAGLFAPFLLDATLLDHLSPNTLIVTDEQHDLALHLDDLDKQAEEARAQLEMAGQIPAGLPLPHRSRAELFAALQLRSPVVDLQRWAVEEEPEPTLTPGPSPARRERGA
ncbi:MAG: hypothetical protein AB7R89_29700 [Dehalococcoidia bacterium]